MASEGQTEFRDRRRVNFFQVGNDVVDQLWSTLSPFACKLYIYFVRRVGQNDGCWPSYDRMCADLGAARGTVTRGVKELVECGLVAYENRRDGRRNLSNLYVLTDADSPISDSSKVDSSKVDSSNFDRSKTRLEEDKDSEEYSTLKNTQSSKKSGAPEADASVARSPVAEAEIDHPEQTSSETPEGDTPKAEKPPKAPRVPRPPDEMFEAIHATTYGFEYVERGPAEEGFLYPPLSSTERSRINRAKSELRPVSATPGQVRKFRAWWTKAHPGIEMAPQSIAKKWTAFFQDLRRHHPALVGGSTEKARVATPYDALHAHFDQFRRPTDQVFANEVEV